MHSPRFSLLRTLRSAALFLLVVAERGEAATLPCLQSSTLEAVAGCIADHMPGAVFAGFVVPSSTVQSDWRKVVRTMLDGDVPYFCVTNYVISPFTENGHSFAY